MKSALNILAALAAIAPLAVQAQIFMCKDATGRTITSDRAIPECADKKVQVLDKQGVQRKEIAAPLTEAQKQEKKLQDEKIAAEKTAAEAKEKEDRTMRARYRNEGDIELARRRSLDVVQEQIKRETRALADAEKNQKDVQAEVGSSRVDLQACKLEYSIVSPK